MAARDITHVDIFRGRPDIVTINGSAAEIISLQNIKDGIVVIQEEIKKSTYEVVDSTEMTEKQGRKITFEFKYDELVQADIQAIVDGGDEITVATSKGGANDTGKTITITGITDMDCFVEDLMTKITATKTSSDATVLPFAVADNAA